VVSQAQQAERLRRIGMLMHVNEHDPEGKTYVSAFAQALADLGWTDGRNVRTVGNSLLVVLRCTVGVLAGRAARSSIHYREAIMKSSLRQTATPQHRSRPRGNDRPRLKTLSSSHHPRRRFLSLAAGAVALPAVSRIARAQAYPTRPITIMVPFPPGEQRM
jgi:hypothetical protein